MRTFLLCLALICSIPLPASSQTAPSALPAERAQSRDLERVENQSVAMRWTLLKARFGALAPGRDGALGATCSAGYCFNNCPDGHICTCLTLSDGTCRCGPCLKSP